MWKVQAGNDVNSISICQSYLLFKKNHIRVLMRCSVSLQADSWWPTSHNLSLYHFITKTSYLQYLHPIKQFTAPTLQLMNPRLRGSIWSCTVVLPKHGGKQVHILYQSGSTARPIRHQQSVLPVLSGDAWKWRAAPQTARSSLPPCRGLAANCRLNPPCFLVCACVCDFRYQHTFASAHVQAHTHTHQDSGCQVRYQLLPVSLLMSVPWLQMLGN